MKLLYITNIPAPYRQKRFNTMARIFPDYNIDFEVLYMAKNEPDREWIIPEDSYNYPHKFFKGIHPVIGRFFAHFNPGLLIRLLQNDYDLAIIGGMGSPTHWLLPFFIRKNKVRVISIESNLFSTVQKIGIGARIKKLLLSKAHAYQVTGNPQIDFIKYFNPDAVKKQFIKLPNLIDETVFIEQVTELRLKREQLRTYFFVDSKTQMWVLPARLISIKGIIPFVKLTEGLRNIKLFLLGDGELAAEVKNLINEKNLPIVIVGFVQQEEVIKYYAAADLFVLPSLKDSSPLSPIEAIASALPILVSSRIGNLEDVLIPDKNGWCYDPIDEADKAKEILINISILSVERLKEMGIESLKIYNEKFNTEKCLIHYAEQLNLLTHAL